MPPLDRRFCGEDGVEGATMTGNGGKGGGREVGRDGSALAKLGGGTTDTTLAMLMAGIAASHLCMHCCEPGDDNDE
jgi:hypothetical protein